MLRPLVEDGLKCVLIFGVPSKVPKVSWGEWLQMGFKLLALAKPGGGGMRGGKKEDGKVSCESSEKSAETLQLHLC